MDHHLLLTAVTLHLDPAVRSGSAIREVFTVSQPAVPAYLRVTKADWTVLAEFERPAKVPEVLRRMLDRRNCPPLREFYEVVLKAHRAGILREEPMPDTPLKPVRWPRIGAGWPRAFGLLAAAGASVLIFVPGAEPSLAPLDLVSGWLLWCLALSLGQMLAASVVAGGEGRIFRPRLRWATWTPHLDFDLREGAMLPRNRQLATALAGLILPAFAVAFAVVLQPAWSLPIVAGWFWRVRPLLGGDVERLLELALGRVRPDTRRDYLFGPNRGLYARRRAAVRSLSSAVVATSLVYGVAWCLAVLSYGMRVARMPMETWWGEPSLWRQAGIIFAAWLVAIVGLLVAVEAAWWCWRRLRSARSWFKLGMRRREFAAPVPFDEAAKVARLARSPLFRRLTPEQQVEVARVAELKEVAAGTLLHDYEEDPPVVGLILSGEVRQVRRSPTGHAEKIHPLTEDEVFGVCRVGDPSRRVRAKARTHLWYLALSKEEFDRLVVAHLGPVAVEQAAVRTPFLRRLELCATWHPQALARFAQLTTAVECAEGDVIIRRGDDTLQLFIVQEGRVDVLPPKGRRRTLSPGAFFGEIGLLQNSPVVADVKARTKARCLAIQKNDFLRFLTHNPSVGLQVERVSSDRLGHPIFPLSRYSFDIR